MDTNIDANIDANTTMAEIRRELQQILSKERDLVRRVDHATASAEYLTLRNLADELVSLVERRDLLRKSLIEAKAREVAVEGSVQRRSTDQAADTWRLLR